MAFESAGTLGLPKGLPSTDLLSNEQSLEVGDPTLTSTTDASSPQTASEFVRWVNKQLVQHEPSVLTWREQAKDATRFRDGHQLSDEDIQILRSQRRPDTAINEIQKFLKFAGGIERRTQQALMFAPREITDQTAQTKGELIGSFYQWFIDQSSGQYERSLAFEDKLITGMGWVDMGITRVLDASGDPRYNKLDAFQMLWPECLSGDTDVCCPPIHATYRRAYNGELIHIALENGKKLTGTPNHPVLTVRGWKPLGVLDPSDKLVDGSLIERLDLLKGYFDDVETRLEQRVDTFGIGKRSSAMRINGNEFYGDGRGSKVYEVVVNEQLWGELFRDELSEQFKKMLLTSGHARIGNNLQPFQTILNGIMIDAQMTGHLSNIHASLMRRQKAIGRDFAKVLGVVGAIAARRATRKFQAIIDGTLIGPTKTGLDLFRRQALVVIKSGNLLDLSGQHGLTEFPSIGIRSLRRSSCHDFPVFDLRTDSGFFLAQGIIASNCSKENLGFGTPSPVRWTGRESDMDLDEAIRKWPDQAMYLRAAAGGGANQDQFPDFGRGAGKPINYVVPWIMTEPLNKGGGAANTGKPGKVKILEWQYYDDEPGYYFFDPLEKDDTWLNNSDFRKYRARLKLLGAGNIQDYDPQDKRVFKRAFILQRRILLDDPKKLPTQTGYTWNCMTGTWDREDKCFYGIVRVLMSPQRYANAFFRQTLEVMGASFKGGGLFESNAMTKAQAQDIKDSGSTPGAWHAVQPGAIQQNKIMFKPPITMPQGSLEVLNFCIDIMDKITGLSQSLMGADQSNTAGVTLRKRLTSGMILLAAEFDQLSRFRKHEGHIIFDFMKLIADNRIINIGGPFDGQAIRLTKDPFALKYDIVLDEIEQDPNMRQVYQDAVLQLAPILIRTGNFIPDLLDYVNLPAQFRQKLKQGMQQQEQAKQQMTQQGLSVGGRGKPRSLAEIKAQEFLTQARGLEHITKSVEHLSKAKATSASTRRDNQRSVFDMAHSTAKMHQDDQKITLDALAKLFEALRPQNEQSPARGKSE